MKKRFTFQCWNCPQTYTLLREITDKMQLFTACPFCGAEAVVNLNSFVKPAAQVLRSATLTQKTEGITLELPEVLPTQEPE